MEKANIRIVFITYLRAFAAMLIFNCHLLFIANKYALSMWLNVGVPVFFIISAFLMAGREYNNNEDVLLFYKKRFYSIYIPYEIYLLCVIAVLAVLRKLPQIKAILLYALGAAAFSDVHVLGLGHLWYISIILICYLITPIIYKINTIDKGKSILLLLTVAQFIVFIILDYPSYGVHIGSYVLLFSFFQRHQRIISRKQLKDWGLAAIAFSLFRILFDDIFAAMNPNIYYYYDSVFQSIARLALAMGIFAVFAYFSNYLEEWHSKHTFWGTKIIGAFSGFSFEFYLVHQFIELSVWEYLPVMKFGIAACAILFAGISFILSILNAIILKYIEKKVNSFANHM